VKASLVENIWFGDQRKTNGNKSVGGETQYIPRVAGKAEVEIFSENVSLFLSVSAGGRRRLRGNLLLHVMAAPFLGRQLGSW